jgi:hypothetical protein
VTLLEPGAYATDFSSHSSLKIAAGIDAYVKLREQIFASGANIEFGDPQTTAEAILTIVDVPNPPLRFFASLYLNGNGRGHECTPANLVHSPDFHFTYYLNQFRLARQNLKYGELVDEWLAERERRQAPSYKPAIAEHGEYNRYIRDFFADEQNKGKSG